MAFFLHDRQKNKKDTMKILLKSILGIITRMIIKKYNPYIIAVTGSVGKTSTKEAIVSVLSNDFSVKGSAGNLNTEFGAPLVFFDHTEAVGGVFDWIKIITKGVRLLIFRDSNYAKVIVSEMAADKPGDIGYLSSIIKPHTAVITAVGETPVHVEFYKNAEDVAKEKEKILSFLPKNKGTAILCLDDRFVANMRGKETHRITFGFNEGADIQIKNFKNSLSGISFNILYEKENISLFVPQCIGRSSAYSVTAAFAVGVSLGMKPGNISVNNIKSLPGRLSLIEGKNKSTIIDGSYNASPVSVISALDCLEELPGKRKIAVIGDMLELGTHSLGEHQKVAEKALSFCDYLLLVGNFSNKTKDNILKKGFKKDHIFSFVKSEEALSFLSDIISSGDLVLVKGSQGVRTEKIVFGIMRYPEMAGNLLVRQSSYWKKK